jgi:hypothetical protein
MHIRLSWQRLIALLLFLAALVVLVLPLVVPRARSRPSEEQPAQGPTSGDALVQGFFETSTAKAMPTLPPTATAMPMEQPTFTLVPIPTLAPIPTTDSAASQPTAAPAATQGVEAAPPTEEPLPTTAAPTAVPELLRLLTVGFGQQKDYMSYAFVVENPNAGLLTRDTLYQMAAYDEAGTVLRTESSFIDLVYPGQQVVVAKVLTMPPEVQVARVEIQFRQRTFAEATGVIPQLEILSPAFIPNPEEFPRITGVIRNTLSEDLSDLPVVGIAFDGDEVIGGGATVISFIPAQGEAAVSIPIATSRTATRVVIFPRLNPITSS